MRPWPPLRQHLQGGIDAHGILQKPETPRRGAGMIALQSTQLLSQTGSVTVVGLLLVAVVALYLGAVSPKHSVEELRTRLKEREAEAEALHEEHIKHIEEKAELRGELAALRREVESLRSEIGSLRKELERYRAGTP